MRVRRRTESRPSAGMQLGPERMMRNGGLDVCGVTGFSVGWDATQTSKPLRPQLLVCKMGVSTLTWQVAEIT